MLLLTLWRSLIQYFRRYLNILIILLFILKIWVDIMHFQVVSYEKILQLTYIFFLHSDQ